MPPVYASPGRVAQSVGIWLVSQGSWVRYPVWPHTFVSPSADSRGAVVSYWQKYVHEVLANRLGGLSLPRKSVVRLTDRPDMTLDVYCDVKQQYNNNNLYASVAMSFDLQGWNPNLSKKLSYLYFCEVISKSVHKKASHPWHSFSKKASVTLTLDLKWWNLHLIQILSLLIFV